MHQIVDLSEKKLTLRANGTQYSHKNLEPMLSSFGSQDLLFGIFEDFAGWWKQEGQKSNSQKQFLFWKEFITAKQKDREDLEGQHAQIKAKIVNTGLLGWFY